VDIGPPETKTFEKSYTTSGPVTLDIQNGSGDVTVTTGPSGQVRVRGEARLHAHLMATGTQRRLEEIAEKPPITQTGEILRITRPLPIGAGSLSINYTIEVPRNTEVRVRNGSGDIAVQGVDGPVALETGSGDIEVQGIALRADVNAGSGDISLREIRGEVVTGARSGNLHLESVSGDIRAHTASGDIRIARPGGKVQARASSGDIEIDGVTADLRVTTSSGDCRITGNPAPRSDWEIETRSGEVILDVPERASFQFYGKSRSEVDSRVEMDVTEKARRALRGRVGKGEARVTVETGSGRILIR
jgi:DUF4097 and DUF4098 domain-containing protein YvlB